MLENMEIEMGSGDGDGDGGESQDQMVKVKTSDDKIIMVPLKVASMFRPIKDMFDSGFNLTDSDAPIPLQVKAGTLETVIVYAKMHLNDEEKAIDEDLTDDVLYSKRSTEIELSDWDLEFFKVELKVLSQIILAADYLDIPSLLKSAVRIVTNKIKGKEPEEIGQMLNIKNDLTEAQQKLIKEENKWIEEKEK